MAVCEPDGELRASTTVSSGGELGARASFERGIHAAREVLAAAAPGREVAAVGVSTFGIPFDDRVELAPTIDGWGELPLGREVRAAFPGAAVRMETDAKAAAQAEARGGAGVDPATYLTLGTGPSAAMGGGGKVLHGSNGAAGEIGYNLRATADVGVPLAARTMLEDMISGQGLARRAAGHTTDGGPMEAAEVFEAGPGGPGPGPLLARVRRGTPLPVGELPVCPRPVRVAGWRRGRGGGWVRGGPGLGPAGGRGSRPLPPPGCRTRRNSSQPDSRPMPR